MIPYLDPSVSWTLSGRPAVAALYQQTADGISPILADSVNWQAPIVANAPDSAQAANDTTQLAEAVSNGWAEAAADQNQLQVDDELSHDGAITGSISAGQNSPGPSAGSGGTPPDAGPSTDPAGNDVRRFIQSAKQRALDAVDNLAPLDPSLIPAESVNALVARALAAESQVTAATPPTTQAPTPTDTVDPASFRAIVDRVTLLEQQGVQGPAGADGAPGPPGPPGPPGRSIVIFG